VRPSRGNTEGIVHRGKKRHLLHQTKAEHRRNGGKRTRFGTNVLEKEKGLINLSSLEEKKEFWRTEKGGLKFRGEGGEGRGSRNKNNSFIRLPHAGWRFEIWQIEKKDPFKSLGTFRCDWEKEGRRRETGRGGEQVGARCEEAVREGAFYRGEHAKGKNSQI